MNSNVKALEIASLVRSTEATKYGVACWAFEFGLVVQILGERMVT